MYIDSSVSRVKKIRDRAKIKLPLTIALDFDTHELRPHGDSSGQQVSMPESLYFIPPPPCSFAGKGT